MGQTSKMHTKDDYKRQQALKMFTFFVDGANKFEIKGEALNDYVRKSKCLNVEKARFFECQKTLEVCLKEEVALWRSHA